MRNHLCQRNNWSKDEFKLIDWPTHGIGVRKHLNLKRFFVKLLHDWLPLGAQVAKYQQDLSAKCPSCPHEIEDRDHFLRFPSRKFWQEELIKDLRHYFTYNPTREALNFEGYSDREPSIVVPRFTSYLIMLWRAK
jgi:hypothetical protein